MPNKNSKSEYNREDYFDKYGAIMQFDQNKDTYIHGWYPFVEGYSKEFINSIIKELDYKPTHCLEPFAGSGTTPLELQEMGIECTSFEVSPFMHTLSTTKLNTSYTVSKFEQILEKVTLDLENFNENIEDILPPPNFRTIVEKPNLKKWNFNREVMKGLLDIKYAISKINDITYKNLFKVALASILLKVSNVYRNGKCLSYKDNWKKNINYSREEVHNIFINRLRNTFYTDISKLEKHAKSKNIKPNIDKCYLGDVRTKIQLLENNSIDLVITSPPYLNSRDYTDTYMIELRMLDYIKNYEDLRNHRKKTFRSHVQVKWDDVKTLDIDLLKVAIEEIQKNEDSFWNISLPNMIKGYFEDMHILFSQLNQKVMNGGKVYFNVANSAYYGVEIKTDEIVSKIAENNGFIIEEIRKARKIKPSSQQKNKIDHLIESVIVMKKKAV